MEFIENSNNVLIPIISPKEGEKRLLRGHVSSKGKSVVTEQLNILVNIC